jgi:hypothetical protein
VTTHRIGLPSEVRRALEDALPRQNGALVPVVRVTPRDSRHLKCAAYEADHYEVQAYYTTSDPDCLNRLQQALREVPGVTLTAQVLRADGRNQVSDSQWPAALGRRRRGFADLRPQVLALMSD